MKKIYLNIILLFMLLGIFGVYLFNIYIPSIPNGSIVLRTMGRMGNQLFEYSAAYALAKQTSSKLYIYIDQSREAAKENNYTLTEFNIPKENIIYRNKYNQYYFDLLYSANISGFLMRSLLDLHYVNDKNFFVIAKSKNLKTLVMNDYFASYIYFKDFHSDVIKLFKINGLNLDKLMPIINKVALKNSVCLHLRKTDAISFPMLQTSIEYTKKAINLSVSLVNNPRLFIFSDDLNLAAEELRDNKLEMEFIVGNTPLEDFYLLSHCRNNILTRSTFGHWGGYLKQNNGLVIAPYLIFNDLINRKEVKAGDDRGYPNDWILLDEHAQSLSQVAQEYLPNEWQRDEILAGYRPKAFNIYSGDRRELELCKDNEDFSANLCYVNKAQDNSITVVASYYGYKNEAEVDDFLSIPFNLVIYTNKENATSIKQRRGDLPLLLIEEPENKMRSGLVTQVIEQNPYKSDFFVWCDIDAFKNKQDINNNFTSNKYMMHDKISMLVMKNAEDGAAIVADNIIVGDARAWRIYDELQKTSSEELMTAKYPQLFNLIYQDPRDEGERLDYLLRYYSGDN